jgi:hypothetical protein
MAAHDTSSIHHARILSIEGSKDSNYMAPETRPLPKYYTDYHHSSNTMIASSRTIMDSSMIMGSSTMMGSSTIVGSSTIMGSLTIGDRSGTGRSGTMESDVYGMAMVIYEARPYRCISSCPRVEAHISFLGFDRDSASLRVSLSRISICRGGGNSYTASRRDRWSGLGAP